jgi:hypothetical protein
VPVTPPAKPRVGLFVLVTGFVTSVAPVAIASVTSMVEVSRAQREVIGLFQEGERTTYLLGHLGKQLLRSHLMLREIVSEGRGQFESTRAEALQISADVAASTSELVPLLSPEERQEWNTIAPVLERLRNAHEQTLRALHGARQPQASGRKPRGRRGRLPEAPESFIACHGSPRWTARLFASRRAQR